VLYFNQMNVDEREPRLNTRDRFVLSKGHCVPALYNVLAQRGFFEENELKGLRKLGSDLQGHPDMNSIPGIDASGGSLGQGLSVANGMAIASKMDKVENRVYCLIGDGELQEGQIWEAAMSASHYKLDNLCVIIDNNNLQIDGQVSDVMNIYPIDEKFKSFGFEVINIDGHDMKEIVQAFETAKGVKGKPTVIVAKTVKGKGVSFMEGLSKWHGSAPDHKEYEMAMRELS